MQFRITPDEIKAERLPRARVGGYATVATEALLTQASWDYRQALHDLEQMYAENAQLQERIEALEKQADALRAEATAGESKAGRVDATLQTAQRVAREERESARRDCEVMLKKTRRRVAEMERAVDKKRSALATELRDLETETETVRKRLREYLTTTLAALDPLPEPELEREPSNDSRPTTDGLTAAAPGTQAPAELAVTVVE